jgi:hypothetical protein
MEADWEFEIGGDAPVIDANWAGLVDLRADPELALGLPETAELPALAFALKALNSAGSPVWTSKSDYWPALQPADFDVDELDGPRGAAVHGMGCYIDLLPRVADAWSLPQQAEAVCSSLCETLRQVRLRSCRVDLVVRRASFADGRNDMGITAYITACGRTPTAAKGALAEALAAFAAALCPGQTLQ